MSEICLVVMFRINTYPLTPQLSYYQMETPLPYAHVCSLTFRDSFQYHVNQGYNHT